MGYSSTAILPRRAWRQFLQSVGCAVDDDDLDYILSGHRRSEILRHFLGELSQAEIDAYGKRKDEFFREIAVAVKPIPGVIEFLDCLKRNNIAAAVATSAGAIRAHSTLAQLRVMHHFTVITTGADVLSGKPDPEIYRLTCQRLNVDPVNALAIEDAPAGIQAAGAAGLRCVGVAGPERSQELIDAGAGCVIENFLAAGRLTLDTILDEPLDCPNSAPLPTSAVPTAR
ncbi:MAG: HAD family phosphatase [Acidobacteriales bacterium]|nr:HAD family phosphatase [Terriglobales bacterium]